MKAAFVGLGLFRTISDREHLSNCSGCREHFSRVSVNLVFTSSHFFVCLMQNISVSTINSATQTPSLLDSIHDLLPECSLLFFFLDQIVWTNIYRLLQAAIGGFSTIFPDYQDRIARHEAAHFLGKHIMFNLFGVPCG